MNRFLPLLALAAVLAVAGCTATPPAAPTPPIVSTSIAVTTAPTSAVATIPVSISWAIDGPAGTTSHTAIHYGPASVPQPTGPADYPSASAYLSGSVPGSYEAEITPAAAGTLYYRAHTIVGEQHFWSVERTLEVTALPSDLQDDLAGAEDELAAVEGS